MGTLQLHSATTWAANPSPIVITASPTEGPRAPHASLVTVASALPAVDAADAS